MVLSLNYITKQKGELPINVWVKRVLRATMLEYQIDNKEERNSWCLQEPKPCFMYNCKPCCPPKVKLFSQFPIKKYMYVVMVGISFEDYCNYSPKTKELGKRAHFLYMSAAHKISASIQNSISSSFEGQAFRVWGCVGCRYMKDGKCKRFMPPLEGTGINVIQLAEDLFDFTMLWSNPIRPITELVALGGIYTDEEITTKEFKEVIKNVCKHN